MKIITGSLRGRNIRFKPNSKLRPTQSQIREAFVNVMSGALAGSTFIDCFSGTGAMGFEAISNGAKKVIFIEKDRSYCKFIQDTLKELALEDRAVVYQGDYKAGLKRAMSSEKGIDILFSDPPYDGGFTTEVINMVAENVLVRKDGWLICETMAKENLADSLGAISRVKTYEYGETNLHYYRIQ